MFNLPYILTTEARERISQIALRDCSDEVREEPLYIEVFGKKKQKQKLKNRKPKSHNNG